MKYTLLPYWIIIFLCSCFTTPLSYAEVVYYNTTEEIHLLPIKKNKRGKRQLRKKRKKRLFKKPNQTEANIVSSLYVTFAILILLPILIILGITLIGVGFPSLIFAYLGLGFIILGNMGLLLAGSIAGATKQYSSQILSFGLWVIFGINLVGAITLLLLNLFLFSSLFIWLVAAGLFALAIFAVVWALIIRQQNKALRN